MNNNCIFRNRHKNYELKPKNVVRFSVFFVWVYNHSFMRCAPLIKSLTLLILALSFLFVKCSTVAKDDNANEIVIKIGEFTIDRQSYERQQEKMLSWRDDLSEEEISIYLLDNYIRAGLLTESAKKQDYHHRKEFIEQDSLYREELVVKYNQYRRMNRNRPFHVDRHILDKLFQNEIKIDYIRIPKEYHVLSERMFDYLTDGTTIPSIFKNLEFKEWNRHGFSFYEDISLKQAILPYPVIKRIMTMQTNEVKVIKAKSAWYVVRFLQSMKPSEASLYTRSVLQNILMAQSLEEGDVVFEPYRLKYNIKCNETLLSKIDFSISPFLNRQDPDRNFVAELSGQLISKDDIKEKIAKLPIQIQSLFVNRSTRKKAVATLILLNYCRENKHIGSSALLETAPAWQSPEKLAGFDRLKFDFGAIGKMRIAPQDSVPDHLFLAWSDNWHLSVKDFKNELDKLAPETRFDIVNNKLFAQMIAYLAKRDSGNRSPITIRSNLFESIDLFGKSYDSLNAPIKETDIVGRLGRFRLSVSDLRELYVRLPEIKRMLFLAPSTRKEIFDELIIHECWRNLYDRKIIEEDPTFKKEVSDHQNWLLAQLFYKSEIELSPAGVNELLGIKKRQEVDSVNEVRLKNFLEVAEPVSMILVDTDYFRNHLNLIKSQYSSRIHNLNR